MNDEKNNFDQPIMGHEYDGIKEFDNPLPMWWLWTFFGTIIFSFIYYIHYEFKVGPTLEQELANDMSVIEKQKAEAGANSGPTDWKNILGDPSKAQLGGVLFSAKCASCHGDKGQGLVGPNLTDKAWLHGAEPNEIYKVVAKGVLDKGMPPWEGLLKNNEIEDVVSFIISIKGTHPAGGKPPQGKEVPNYF